MKIPEEINITGNIGDIYRQFDSITQTCVGERKKGWIFGGIGVIIIICAFSFIPPLVPMLLALVTGIIFIVMGVKKHRTGGGGKQQLIEMIQGVMEGLKDDLRNQGAVAVNCALISKNKPVESDNYTPEPYFSSVRRIKYKYKTTDLRFSLFDGNILKVRIYAKEREKIKVDHRTKKTYKTNFFLKLRLDVNPKCYDMVNGSGQSHISLKAPFSTIDKSSGTQVAGMVKGMYSGITLKRFSQG